MSCTVLRIIKSVLVTHTHAHIAVLMKRKKKKEKYGKKGSVILWISLK